MNRRTFSLLLLASSGVACTQTAVPKITMVSMDAQGFSIDQNHFASTSELVVALKAIPKLEAIGIQTALAGDQARLDQVVKEIRAAGISVPIAAVGNETFNK